MSEGFTDAVQMLQEGDPSGALAIFQHLATTARSDGLRADALYNVAVCQLRLGSETEALDAISDAVRSDPHLADEIRTDPDFSTLAGNPWFERALRAAIVPAAQVEEESPFKEEVRKAIWEKIVPLVALILGGGIATATGLPTILVLGLMVFCAIAVPLSMRSLWKGDIEGVKGAVVGAATLAGSFVAMIIGVIALAIILTGLGC